MGAALCTHNTEKGMHVSSALIIFDIDGTLFETRRVTVPAVQRTFAAHGLPVPDADAIMSFTGHPVEQYRAWLAGLCPPDRACEIVEEADRTEVALIGTEGRLYAGVEEALDALEGEGHVLALCSNAPDDYMEAFLRASGLRSRLCAWRCRGTRDTDKTRMVGELVASISNRPVIVVGDRRDDVDAAHAHGGLAVGAEYGFGSPKELARADARVASPRDIPDAVRSLLQPARSQRCGCP